MVLELSLEVGCECMHRNAGKHDEAQQSSDDQHAEIEQPNCDRVILQQHPLLSQVFPHRFRKTPRTVSPKGNGTRRATLDSTESMPRAKRSAAGRILS